jgi:outer membrane immunogenic protein
MHRVIAAASALVALTLSASAADMPMPYKAPPPAVYSGWTGFYLGLNGGGGIGLSRSDFSVSGIQFATARNTVSGGLGGVQAGYNWQTGMAVVGLEADFQGANLTGGISAPCPAGLCNVLPLTATYNQKLPWFGTVRGRLGLAQGGWLFYVTGGYTYARLETDAFAAAGPASASYSLHETRSGWNIGTGVEVMFAGNWTARLEYLYLDLGKRSTSMTFAGLPTIVDDARFGMHIARLAVNYKF